MARMEQDAGGILSACPLFAEVRGESFERLVRIARMKSYAQGELIFRQGDPCPGVFVVGSGLVRIYKTSPAGKEHVLHLCPPRGTFAEVAAIGGFDCPAFAEALEETRCVLLPTDAFTAALQEDHQLCLQLLTGMSVWVKHLVSMIESIALRDAVGRVARYLLSAADGTGGSSVQLPSLKKHLASHLNLTAETLSRTLRRLTEMGMIAPGPDDEQSLVITDRQSLGAAAEGEFPVL